MKRPATIYEVNSTIYIVEFRKDLSQMTYTQSRVYHIFSDEESYPKAHKEIAAIMQDGSITVGEYKYNYSKNPTFSNYLRKYHEFSWDEELGCYVYILHIPYED
jgi:hypothetical protein